VIGRTSGRSISAFLHRGNRQVGVGLIQRHPNPRIEIRLPHEERVVRAVPHLHFVPLVVARKMILHGARRHNAMTFA
jgi:hypothetical protein